MKSSVFKFLFVSSAVCFVFVFAGMVLFYKVHILIETFQNNGRGENVFHLFPVQCIEWYCSWVCISLHVYA